MSVRCVSSTENVNNARYVQTQCMHVVRHAIVEVNVVIGVLVVHGELLVVMRVVPVFLIVMLQFIAFVFSWLYTVAIVFIVAILRRILLYWMYSVYTRSITVTNKSN